MVKVRKSRVAPPCAGECPLSNCMRLISGAWAPHIIWYLREGPRRFSELKGDIRGVSSKVLAARLRQLDQDGVVQRTVMRTSPPTVEYRLTALGAELVPAIAAIVDVSQRLRQQRMTAPPPAGGMDLPGRRAQAAS
ncbi:MAG TPA: helix-turn-helix domain-containing protein [Solimonas sp.]|nr:helix-turn-helix domain-containing protein [Solimonas sp.]